MRFCFPVIVISCVFISGFVSAEPTESGGRIIRQEDVARARENLARHGWAKAYLASLRREVDPWKTKMDEAFLQQFIPETTPGGKLLPCPSCRDSGKTYLPGNWLWKPETPDVIHCRQCKTDFPNDRYPEDVVVQTQWGRPQTITFFGGEPMTVFSYKEGRGSVSGTLRANKVGWITGYAEKAAHIYALTGDVAYAETVREILLRFSETYPYWLIHVGYGEYADMEPAVAAKKIAALPADEKVFPPNRPDRKLFAGYWSAGRAGAGGMEGIFVSKVALAYDLTRDARRSDGGFIYSDADRTRIGKDLLLEGTLLLVADRAINNKSVGNRAAAGMVGLVLNDPELVRFGMEGFTRTVDEWFLADGGTPESPAYALMAINGVAAFAQALRGYSDPVGYRDANGRRYDHFNPYRDTLYERIWEGMFLSLQGDLKYPPFADSYITSRISPTFAELMAGNYPEKEQFQALLYAILGGRWERASGSHAIYCADPLRAEKPVPELHLPSHLFPVLKIGFMRTGKDGRESLALLSASDWGAHHHQDSLNLYYWKNGEELWSDLGYLWDHPEKRMTSRTFAHNTVLVDEKEQLMKGLTGTVRYFVDRPEVKAMRAASNAYPEAKMYERAITLIDHGSGRNYLVDVFWVEGGRHQDYVYHGPNEQWSLIAPAPVAEESVSQRPGWLERIREWFGPSAPASQVSAEPPEFKEADQVALYDLTEVKRLSSDSAGPHRLQWQLAGEARLTVWQLPMEGEQIFIGSGWGQRDTRNKDRGARLPYVVRRSGGEGRKAFISLLEGHSASGAIVRDVRQLKISGSSAIVLQITTTEGRDYVVVNPESGPTKVTTPDGVLETGAMLAVLSLQGQEVRFHAVNEGAVHLKRSGALSYEKNGNH